MSTVLRFILIGMLNALIMALTVYAMMQWAGAGYVAANVTAYLLAQTHNFLWSKYWVFAGGRRPTRHQALLFVLAFAVAYGAQLLTTVALVEACHLHPYPAQFIALLVYGTVNYLLNRRLTFS